MSFELNIKKKCAHTQEKGERERDRILLFVPLFGMDINGALCHWIYCVLAGELIISYLWIRWARRCVCFVNCVTTAMAHQHFFLHFSSIEAFLRFYLCHFNWAILKSIRSALKAKHPNPMRQYPHTHDHIYCIPIEVRKWAWGIIFTYLMESNEFPNA